MTPALDPAVIAALRGARHVAALTGAGISAESGIPTFRDALTGLWANYNPEDLATPEAFARQPAVVWDWYAGRRGAIRAAQPNAGHRALVELARRVPRFTLITQNVDGLHQRAGSVDVIELHGNILRSRCSREGVIVDDPAPNASPPPCPRCGAPLRPDVVWFGEILPLEALAAAEDAAVTCDVLLSVGTSNLVVPAASLPWMAAGRGATVVVVNTTAEGQHSGPGIHFAVGAAGTVLPALVAAAWPAP
ncbi:MAG: NAD-dependent deacylase [Gemmatimonadota bacterium]|nr:NAD-dependent deacylase [Gemmatimonadota bacterium]MDH4351638.1 NAD-dependent deacylase [Gemmatimonadota bacterium]